MGPTDGAERGGGGEEGRPEPRSPRSISRTTRGSDEREEAAASEATVFARKWKTSWETANRRGGRSLQARRGFPETRVSAFSRTVQSTAPLVPRGATPRPRRHVEDPRRAFVRPLPRARHLSARAAFASRRRRSTATRRVERAPPEPGDADVPAGAFAAARTCSGRRTARPRRVASAARRRRSVRRPRGALAAPPSRLRHGRPPRRPRRRRSRSATKIDPSLIQLPSGWKVDRGNETRRRRRVPRGDRRCAQVPRGVGDIWLILLGAG